MTYSKPLLTPFGHAVAGAGGAALSLLLVYPLDVLKTRLQADPLVKSKLSLSQVINAPGLLDGLPSAILNTLASNFAYFYFYTGIKELKVLGSEPGVARDLVRGALAGALTQLMVTPLSVASTRKQVNPAAYGHLAFPKLIYRIARDDGFRAVFAGLSVSLVLVVNPSITYGFFEQVKRQPFIVAKVALQSQTKYRGMGHVLKKTWQRNGLRGWYKVRDPWKPYCSVSHS